MRQWVRWNFNFLKVYIQSPVNDFVILKLYLILDGLILLHKGDFCCEVRLCNGFWRWHFRQHVQDMWQSLLKQYDHILFESHVHSFIACMLSSLSLCFWIIIVSLYAWSGKVVWSWNCHSKIESIYKCYAPAWVEWGITHYPFMLLLIRGVAIRIFISLFWLINFCHKTSRNGKDANVKSSIGVLRALGRGKGLTLIVHFWNVPV